LRAALSDGVINCVFVAVGATVAVGDSFGIRYTCVADSVVVTVAQRQHVIVAIRLGQQQRHGLSDFYGVE